ncbi:MAG: SMP-30/gluconolactonase/LRE family protein [Deltaproteobacteria bacterium]|nr:SMP-30/gluconolactonase/LRE family protein [Deltaproteobacteria bacterium]
MNSKPSKRLTVALFSSLAIACGAISSCSSSKSDDGSGGDGGGGDQAGQSGGGSKGDGGSNSAGKGGSASGGSGGSAAGGSGGVAGNSAGSGGGGNAGGTAGNTGGSAGSNPSTLLCPAGAQYPAPVPDGATPTKLKDTGFEGTEGPVWVESVKAFFFSDLQRKTMQDWSKDASSKIWKYNPETNNFEVFVAASGSNGLAVKDGKIVAALHSLGGLATFDPATKARVDYITGLGGNPLGSPNDLAVRADGNVYFSDPEWQKPNARPGQGQKVYRVDPQKMVTTVDTLSRPNGVTLSPDGNTLYVTDDQKNVWKYKVAANGSVTKDGKLTTTAGNYPDGMTADCAGNVYVATSAGVEIFSAAGAAVKTIGGLAGSGTNVAFGGTDHKTLLITAGDTVVYSIKLNIPGLPY